MSSITTMPVFLSDWKILREFARGLHMPQHELMHQFALAIKSGAFKPINRPDLLPAASELQNWPRQEGQGEVPRKTRRGVIVQESLFSLRMNHKDGRMTMETH